MMDPVETLARQIVREMWEYTEGLPGRWAPLCIVSERLELEDEEATRAAVQYAVERQWLEEFSDYNSIRLTDAGRSTSVIGDEALDLQAGDAIVPTAKNKAA
jgi:hypothetical protein